MTDGALPRRHQLDFALYDLGPTTVRIDFPFASGAEASMVTEMPVIRFGASYDDSGIGINNLLIQPRRIQFEITKAPPLLPISLQISCDAAFVFGWLLVPENIQTAIRTVAQQIRIVGPGYWALPLAQPTRAPELGASAAAPESASFPIATKSAEKLPAPKTGPAPVKAATGAPEP